jgi:hypothetical protein
MVKGEAVMAVAIKPLRRRRRTAQRGKPMSQSQRWGKVVTTMPVPGGEITTSEILVPVVEEVVEVSTTEEEVIPFERIDTDDLPELS